jgi:hypothetical protein
LISPSLFISTPPSSQTFPLPATPAASPTTEKVLGRQLEVGRRGKSIMHYVIRKWTGLRGSQNQVVDKTVATLQGTTCPAPSQEMAESGWVLEREEWAVVGKGGRG